MHYDKDFLLQLDKDKNKTIYARIMALKFDETPIQTIEGRVTQGSVNIDGASAVRRSCSLTIVAQDFQYDDFYWGLNTKFKLEIGVANFINSAYPDIIWFKQGVYILTSFNTSRTTNNFTISLQGKDKMCLLNGEVGGSLESSIDFGCIEEEVNDMWIKRQIPIKEIIRNMVHVYGKEPYYNIIINDLDDYGLELLEYRYDDPMYLYRKTDSDVFDNILLNGDKECIVYGERKKLKDLGPTELDVLVDSLMGSSNPAPVKFDKDAQTYYIAKVEYGQTAGYRQTDLVYAGDLISNVGESVTSVLDKIKNMLSEFEYFYDLDGQFVFQRKQAFVNTLWTPIVESEDEDKYVESYINSTPYSYVFNKGELINSFNNNPNLLNLRNDFSVWGARKGASGKDIPVHMRYAIDTKPYEYTTYDGKLYKFQYISDEALKTEIKNELEQVLTNYTKTPNPNGLPEDWWDIMDWAEYYKQLTGSYPPGVIGGYCKNYVNASIDLNNYFPIPSDGGTASSGAWTHQGGIYIFDVDYIDGKSYLGYFGHYNGCSHSYSYFLDRAISGAGTSYIYKPDIPEVELSDAVEEIFEQRKGEYGHDWRELIYIMAKDYYANNEKEDFAARIARNNGTLYPTGRTGYEQYYTDIQGFWRELYNPDLIPEDVDGDYNYNDYYYVDNPDSNNPQLIPAEDNRRYWNRAVFERPETLNFWFDFLDQGGALAQYNVQNIGARPKAINDSAVKSIYFRETPNVIFGDGNDIQRHGGGYKFIQIPETYIEDMFSISAQGKSAKDRMDELLYQHSYCIESATISTIPIYYLQPNTRIYLLDEDTGLRGDYIVSKLTIPLSYNGKMSITATKAAENIM